MEFHELLTFLQDLPTRTWGDQETEDILSKVSGMTRRFFVDFAKHAPVVVYL